MTAPDDLGGPIGQAPPVVRATEEIDASAERWSRPAREGDRIVLLLHGLGSNEDDLIGLAPYLPTEYVYVSLRGIFSYVQGYAWLDFPPDAADREKISASAAALERWIARQEGTVVGAIGFSQGAMLALELLRRDPGSLRWAVQLSGAPFPDERPEDAALAERRVPVLWGRGALDPLFDEERIAAVQEWMAAHTEMVAVVSPFLGHGVDEAILGAVVEFVRGQLDAGTDLA